MDGDVIHWKLWFCGIPPTHTCMEERRHAPLLCQNLQIFATNNFQWALQVFNHNIVGVMRFNQENLSKSEAFLNAERIRRLFEPPPMNMLERDLSYDRFSWRHFSFYLNLGFFLWILYVHWCGPVKKTYLLDFLISTKTTYRTCKFCKLT